MIPALQKLCIFTFIYLLPQLGFAQVLENMSFEGSTGESLSPSFWMPCDYNSTPDTQPNAWSVTQPPSHGSAYLSMVCRSEGTYEACYQRLKSPLLMGKCYYYAIDLARADNFWVNDYSKAARLRIWASNDLCKKEEMLWDSGEINHTDWRNYEFILQTRQNSYDYFILEIYYVSSKPYNGNILIDNLVFIKEIPCQM